MEFPHALDALEALGATDEERAAVLGVSTKTVQRLRRQLAGRATLPGLLGVIVAQPRMLSALATDTQQQEQAS